MAKQCPEQMVSFLTCEALRKSFVQRGVPKPLLAQPKLFSIQQWIQIMEPLSDMEGQIASYLSKMAPSKRGAIFEGLYPKAQRQQRVFSTELLCQLPHALREEEVSRMMILREIQENPAFEGFDQTGHSFKTLLRLGEPLSFG